MSKLTTLILAVLLILPASSGLARPRGKAPRAVNQARVVAPGALLPRLPGLEDLAGGRLTCIRLASGGQTYLVCRVRPPAPGRRSAPRARPPLERVEPPVPMPAEQARPEPETGPEPEPELEPEPEPETEPEAPQPAPTLPEVSADELRVLQLANRERQQRGLQPLALDRRASEVARAHARDMCRRGYFDHRSPEGQAPWDRLRAGGVPFDSAGENIAAGYRSAESVHQGWMDSPGHRHNILGSGYSRIGVGKVICEGGAPYWAQVFMG
jgi:uncharacterized protein YkwD